MSILDNIQFFGEADRQGKKADGKIASEYPAFYFPSQIDELQETISKNKRQLELGIVPASERPYMESELKKSEKRLDEILNSKPKLTARQKDGLAKIYDSLGEDIRDSMFTRSEMKKGLVNVHEEVKRMSEPIINVRESEGVFRSMGIEPVNGKVSRNQASKVWKIIGRTLGRNTNTEYLRKDRNYGTYHGERSLEEMERD